MEFGFMAHDVNAHMDSSPHPYVAIISCLLPLSTYYFPSPKDTTLVEMYDPLVPSSPYKIHPGNGKGDTLGCFGGLGKLSLVMVGGIKQGRRSYDWGK